MVPPAVEDQGDVRKKSEKKDKKKRKNQLSDEQPADVGKAPEQAADDTPKSVTDVRGAIYLGCPLSYPFYRNRRRRIGIHLPSPKWHFSKITIDLIMIPQAEGKKEKKSKTKRKREDEGNEVAQGGAVKGDGDLEETEEKKRRKKKKRKSEIDQIEGKEESKSAKYAEEAAGEGEQKVKKEKKKKKREETKPEEEASVPVVYQDEGTNKEAKEKKKERKKKKDKQNEGEQNEGQMMDVDNSQPEEQAEGPTRVMIGNLPYGVDDAALKGRFEQCGEVEDAFVVRNKPDLSSKGFGFVQFKSPHAASRAFSLSDTQFQGRTLKVEAAKSRNEASSGQQSGGNKKVQQGAQTNVVFVKNLPKSVSEEELRSNLESAFSKCGGVSRVRLPCDREKNTLKGFGFIEFEDSQCAGRAIDLDGSQVMGCAVKVDLDSSTGKGRTGASPNAKSGSSQMRTKLDLSSEQPKPNKKVKFSDQ